MTIKLTDVFVSKLRAGRKYVPGTIVWDQVQTGLGIKLLPSGKKVFVLQAKFPGNRFQARRSLGEYPGFSLAEARRKAESWRQLAKRGIDPATVEEEERRRLEAERIDAAARRENTLASYAEKFISERRNRRAKADAREIRRMLLPALGDKPISEITAQDVRVLFDRLKIHAPFDARNAWGHLVQIFKHAVHEGLVVTSPCASLDKRLVFRNTRLEPRQRVLSDDEIRKLWHATGVTGYPFGPLVRMALLSGCRKSEVADARWREFDLPSRTWTVPAERFKSNVPHTVPLSDELMAVLGTLPRHQGGDFLFSVTNGAKPFRGLGKAKRKLDAEMEEVAGWVLHDLRRVVRSNLAALGVAENVSEMVLGHDKRGLARI